MTSYLKIVLISHFIPNSPLPFYNQLNIIFFIHSVTIFLETVASEALEHASQSVPMVSTSTPGLSAPAGQSGVEERDEMFMDAGDR